MSERPPGREPVSVALIGAGNFARRQHLPNLSRIPEARLRTVCDIDRSVAEEARARYGAGRAETNYRRVLEDPAVQAVVVATRTDLQAPVAVAALEAGKHVYVEKPLAERAEDFAAVAEARDRSGCRLAVGFNKRFAPIYRKAREVMRADGGPRNMHIRMADDAWRWAQGYPPGHLLTLDVCHIIDLLRWFTGREVASVYCVSPRPDDDSLLVGMTGECVASVLFSGHGSMDMPKERIDAVCGRGGLSAEDYVELSTYGYTDYQPVYRYAAHAHPEGEYMHTFLTASLGLEGWKAIRRGSWETWRRTQEAGGTEDPYAAEARRYSAANIPNFMRDQGWLGSLRAFVRGLQSGETTGHAGVEDALAASEGTRAAARSRESGEVVRLRGR